MVSNNGEEDSLNVDIVDNTDRDLDDQDDRGDHIRAKIMSKGSAATESSKSKNRPSTTSLQITPNEKEASSKGKPQT